MARMGQRDRGTEAGYEGEKGETIVMDTGDYRGRIE